MDYNIAAVERALALLEAVAAQPGIGLTELARAVGCTKTLAFRVAATLEARGYLVKDADKGYTVGYRPLKLVEHMQGADLLLTVSAAAMDALLAETAENVVLTVRDGLESVCVANRQSPQPLRLYAELGRRGPLHVGGGPKVLLAHAPADIRAAVLAGDMRAFTEATIRDGAQLDRVLARIRQCGHNISLGDLDAGAFSIAAPVHDHAGRVVAALSVAGPQSRLTPERKRTFVALVRGAADDVSARLGWAATPPG